MAEEKNKVLKAILEFCIRTIINLCLVFFLMEGYTTSFRFAYTLFADYPYAATSKTLYEITITEGMSPKELALVLETNGIVDSDELFLARVYLGKYASKIKAGTYSLGPSMSPDEICKCICGIQGGGNS